MCFFVLMLVDPRIQGLMCADARAHFWFYPEDRYWQEARLSSCQPDRPCLNRKIDSGQRGVRSANMPKGPQRLGLDHPLSIDIHHPSPMVKIKVPEGMHIL